MAPFKHIDSLGRSEIATYARDVIARAHDAIEAPGLPEREADVLRGTIGAMRDLIKTLDPSPAPEGISDGSIYRT